MRMTALLLLGVLVCIGGCGDDGRKPPPEVVIQVLDQPGSYLYAGNLVHEAELRAQLQELADRYRRPTTNTSRAVVRIYHPTNVAYSRLQGLISWCGDVGLDKVTVQARDATTSVPGANQSLSPRH
jgi:biopolymer transport protein ExbD